MSLLIKIVRLFSYFCTAQLIMLKTQF